MPVYRERYIEIVSLEMGKLMERKGRDELGMSNKRISIYAPVFRLRIHLERDDFSTFS